MVSLWLAECSCFYLSYNKNAKNLPANAGDSDLILGLKDPLEEGTAIHSSILAWRIPWTEEPGEV